MLVIGTEDEEGNRTLGIELVLPLVGGMGGGDEDIVDSLVLVTELKLSDIEVAGDVGNAGVGVSTSGLKLELVLGFCWSLEMLDDSRDDEGDAEVTTVADRISELVEEGGTLGVLGDDVIAADSEFCVNETIGVTVVEKEEPAVDEVTVLILG